MKTKREKKVLDENIINEKIAKGEKITFAEKNIMSIKAKRLKSTEKMKEYGKNHK